MNISFVSHVITYVYSYCCIIYITNINLKLTSQKQLYKVFLTKP